MGVDKLVTDTLATPQGVSLSLVSLIAVSRIEHCVIIIDDISLPLTNTDSRISQT